jgi:hypothetical protein
MKVTVQELVGDVCITQEDGERLYAAYRAAFDAGETVELDFAGTRIFTSQFFNVAVGQLLKDHTIDVVRQRLRFLKLPAAATEVLRRSVQNAESYHRDPKFQEALDRVLADQAVEA